ncbi:hypothetical protein [Synechococcus sp. HB1133]|nr:hypothetical protein [Synechococcus sp. HB1133]
MDASDLDGHILGGGSSPGNQHEHALPFRAESAESGKAVALI